MCFIFTLSFYFYFIKINFKFFVNVFINYIEFPVEIHYTNLVTYFQATDPKKEGQLNETTYCYYYNSEK